MVLTRRPRTKKGKTYSRKEDSQQPTQPGKRVRTPARRSKKGAGATSREGGAGAAGQTRTSTLPRIPPELAKKITLDRQSNTLYIGNVHRRDATVTSYLHLAKRKGCEFTSKVVDMDDFAQLLRKHSQVEGETPTASMSDAQALFKRAMKVHASDIHITVERNRTRVEFRVHGDLRPVLEWDVGYGATMLSTIYQAMTDVSDSTYKPTEKQDARISDPAKMPDGVHGIRIATTPLDQGSYMVMRLLYKDTGFRGMESQPLAALGYLEQQDRTIEALKREPNGINIIVGPTGSGKSTTLKYVLQMLHKENPNRNIITVEDPPEYPIAGARQMPVDSNSDDAKGNTFPGSIRTALRLDPDIIMVGEIRDHETCHVAIEASMTGHKVWTTLHANWAFDALYRITDMGISITQIAVPGTLNGIIAQRLVQTLCPHCKLPLSEHYDQLPEYLQAELDAADIDLTDDSAYIRGPGCENCRKTAISGRTTIAEAVAFDEEMMQLIRAEGDGVEQAKSRWREMGGVSAKDSALIKIREGLIDPRDAREAAGKLGQI